jgi:hypothetical protein
LRRGFSIIFAIIILVLVAFISVLALSLSTQTTETTSNIYLREQAKLLAISSTEFAILALSGHDHSVNCLNSVNIDTTPFGGVISKFDINISIAYIADSLLTSCSNSYSGLQYKESNLTVLIDTIVSSKNDIYPPIREHRRMLQKP